MSGFVYFVSYGTTGWIKIGYASSLKRRLTALQISSPEVLTIEASVPGTQPQEKALHRALHRLRGSGEWFRPDPLISLLMEMALSGDPVEDLIAFAKEPVPDDRKSQVKRLQVIQWSRWSQDEKLPETWRSRYRSWLKEDHGVIMPKLRGVVGQADELRAVA